MVTRLLIAVASAVVLGCGGMSATPDLDGGGREASILAPDAGPRPDDGGALSDRSLLDAGDGADACSTVDSGQPTPVPLAAGASCAPNGEDLASWFTGGQPLSAYQIGLDATVSCNGAASAHVGSAVATAQDFGTMLFNQPPGPWAGHRLRFSAWVKTESVTGTSGLWMRVDTAQKFGVAFDNMRERPIVGTTDWALYQVVLDIAPDASNVAYGIVLAGDGDVWLDGVSIEHVDATCVPTTG